MHRVTLPDTLTVLDFQIIGLQMLNSRHLKTLGTWNRTNAHWLDVVQGPPNDSPNEGANCEIKSIMDTAQRVPKVSAQQITPLSP